MEDQERKELKEVMLSTIEELFKDIYSALKRDNLKSAIDILIDITTTILIAHSVRDKIPITHLLDIIAEKIAEKVVYLKSMNERNFN
jgi:N-dimethylarginine dimethylaminohydrolase